MERGSDPRGGAGRGVSFLGAAARAAFLCAAIFLVQGQAGSGPAGGPSGTSSAGDGASASAGAAPAKGAAAADWDYAPGPPGTVSSVLLQPGGEGVGFLYLLGQRRMDDGRDYPYVARVDPDGDLIALSGPKKAGDEAVLDVAFPEGGKTILAGSFTKFAGKVRKGVARLDAAGRLDEGYAAPPPAGSATAGSAPGSGVATGGTAGSAATGSAAGSGSDSAGSAASGSTASGPAGGPTSGAAGSSATGSSDWGADGPVLKILPAAEGKLLCFGTFARWSGAERKGLALLGPAGQLDPSFDPGRSLANAAGPVLVRSMRALKDGRFLLSGDFDRYDGFALACKGIVLIRADGSYDKSLALPYDSAACLAAREAPAQTVLLFCARKDAAFSLVEADPSGKLPAGGISAPLPAEALCAVYLPDGSAVLGFGYERKTGDPALAKASLLARAAGGALDATFGAGLSFYAEGERGGILSLALLRDGSIAAGGSFALGEEGRALRNLARIAF